MQRLEKLKDYYIDSIRTFVGVLRSLEARTSTHPGLALLRDNATLAGVMDVHRIVSRVVQ